METELTRTVKQASRLDKLNPVRTHSLKAPGFIRIQQPFGLQCDYWFPKFAFSNFNLYRYNTVCSRSRRW
jgi:hypothetical protein